MEKKILDLFEKQERANLAALRAAKNRYLKVISLLRKIELECSCCGKSNPLSSWGYVQTYSFSPRDNAVPHGMELNELRCKECGLRTTIRSLSFRSILRFVFTEQKLLHTDQKDLFDLQYEFDPETNSEPQLCTE